MTLARWQGTIVDEAGNVVSQAFVEVRREIPGAPLAVLYSDRDGTVPLGNPFQADAEGFAAFHVAGDAHKIRAYKGAFERIWRYVGIGTNQEIDFGTIFLPKGAWSGSTGVVYDRGDVVSHRVGDQVYAFVSNHDENEGNEPPFESGDVGGSDDHWTVLRLIEAPGQPGDEGPPGSSDVVGTSASDVAIGAGAKAFTIVEADRGWGVGARLRVSSDANPTTHWMEGVVTSYAGTALQVIVDLTAGAGSRADWTINLAGEPGEAGDDGVDANLALLAETTGSTADEILADPVPGAAIRIYKASAANGAPPHTLNGRPLLDKDGNNLRAGAIQPDVYYVLLDDAVNFYVIASGFVI